MEDANIKWKFLRSRNGGTQKRFTQWASLGQLFSVLLLSVSVVQSKKPGDHFGGGDGLTKYPAGLFSTIRPCSCDCCEVSLRLPSEVERLSNGAELKHKCTTSEEPTDQCPNTCQMTKDEQVLTSAIGEVDTARFCLYKCIPTLPSAGTMCQRQAADESWVARVPDGNGRRLPIGGATWTTHTRIYTKVSIPSPARAAYRLNWTSTESAPAPAVAPVVFENPEPVWQKEIEKKKVERKEEVEAEQEEVHEKQRTIYDMRKLYTERLRAQAGAMASHEIAAGERVRLSERAVSRNVELLGQAAAVAEALQVSLDTEAAQTDAYAITAREASAKADEFFHRGKLSIKPLLEETRQATMQMVQQGVQEMAREEAESFAKRMFWDKPLNYERVLAYRAAEPYQDQMLAANQRVSEYEEQASGLHDKAKATLQQAEEVASQVNVTGNISDDNIVAVIDRRKARNLLRKSRELQRRGDELWNTAQAARASVRAWQNASWVATIRKSYEYNVARNSAATSSPCLTAASVSSVIKT